MNRKIIKLLLALTVLMLTPTLHFIYVLTSFSWLDTTALGFIRMDNFICDILLIIITICQIGLIVLIGIER